MQVVAVESSKQWRDFFALRREVYRNDPAAVFPLQKMERSMLDTAKHPFYQHASRQAFLCLGDNGKAIGRVVAIKDDMHNEHHGDTVGFFGFFEITSDVDQHAATHRLIEAASTWLKEQGCTSIRGPVNPSMKSDFGFVTDGHQLPPSVMICHSRPEYPELLTKEGFEVAQTFFCYQFTPTESDISKWQTLRDFADKVAVRFPTLEFRTVNPETFADTFREINRLGNDVRSEGWGFVPLTESELDFMIANLRRVIRFDMIHVCYIGDEMVGYIVNIPDVNWALKKTKGRWDWLRLPQLLYWIRRTPRTRVIALGVKEAYRKRGITMTLIKRLTDVHHEYKQWELSWVQHDNVKSIRAISRATDLECHRTFSVYEKEIS